jgi:hypothetical protein
MKDNIIEFNKKKKGEVIKAEEWKGNETPSITYQKTTRGNYKISSDNDIFNLAYYIEPRSLFDSVTADRYIKSCESRVRTSDVYRAYLDYLRNEVNLSFDVFNGNVNQKNATLEFHHGPIFTLYDYCKIAIEWSFNNGYPVCTFNIARIVMEDHASNIVQGAMVTRNNHALLHQKKIHLDLRQCHGDIRSFIAKYHDQIKRSPFLSGKIHEYRSQLEDPAFHGWDFIKPGNTIDWSSKNRGWKSVI